MKRQKIPKKDIVAWMNKEDETDVISHAKKVSMQTIQGKPGAFKAKQYTIPLRKFDESEKS